MAAWIICSFLAGALIAMTCLALVGRRNTRSAKSWFRRSAVLGIYCARIRRGEDDPDMYSVERQADYVTGYCFSLDEDGE